MIELEVEALIDSGAARSLIREDVYRKLKITNKIQPLESIRLFDVQQRELNTLGIVKLTFIYDNKIFIHEFIVTDAIQEEVILGLDAIIKHKFNIKGTGEVVILTQNEREILNDAVKTINTIENVEEGVHAPPKNTVNEGVHAPPKNTVNEGVHAPPSKIKSTVCEGVHAPPSKIKSTVCEGVHAPPSKIKSTVCEGVHAPPSKIQNAVYEGVHAPPSKIQHAVYEGVHAPPSQIQSTAHEATNAPSNDVTNPNEYDNAITTQIKTKANVEEQINEILDNKEMARWPIGRGKLDDQKLRRIKNKNLLLIPLIDTENEIEITEILNKMSSAFSFTRKFDNNLIEGLTINTVNPGNGEREQRPTEKEGGSYFSFRSQYGVDVKQIQGKGNHWFLDSEQLTPEAILTLFADFDQLNSNISTSQPPIEINNISTSIEILDEENLNFDLSEIENDKLKAIFNKFKKIFAKNDFDLGSSDVIKHTIDVQGNYPIRLKPYRPPFKQKEEINRQIEEMLEHGIIRPSKSPWAAPVVLVKKKSGEMRFCINYRQLNNVTKKDSYPLPRIDDILDKMSGKTLFTTLDLASGYFQIIMDDAAKELTAFIVENNLYEFNRMPFGLTNAPSTFQRLMNYVLRTVLGHFALVYLDDIIIYSKTLEDHFNHIETIFRLLHEAGLKLKFKKCHFLKKSVNYLGHIISEDGIAPDPSKIDKIANYRIPQNSEELASFLGLAGYYRPFIQNYGTIAKPLSCQTKKNKKERLVWGETEQQSFETLRDRLTTSPILAYPDFTLQFQIFTDASNYGIGAILSQVQNEKEVVISYKSRHLKPSELKYATIEKEALAVVFGIKQFKHYLQDNEFLVISDHRPLQWLEDIKDENGRLGRWAIQLANMKYKIKYKPGRIHQNADCLSRIQMTCITHDFDSNLSITKRQSEDALCQAINGYLTDGTLTHETDTDPPLWVKEIELFNNTSGLLTRDHWPTSQKRRNEMKTQIVLPLSLRLTILNEYHDKPSSGHLAFQRTYLKIQNKYYWPNMRENIKEYCTACIKCATTSKKINHRAPLHPLEIADAPFSVIAIDFLGPFTPMSVQGNSYIMVVTDYLTKWVEAIPLPDQTADTTSQALLKHIIARHGTPRAILTDQGSNFTSKLFANICVYFKIKRKLTTAYHPQTDGQTERFNRTLMSMLRNYTKNTHDDWEDVLELLCFAYRSSVHSSTHESPYYLMHGRDPPMLIDRFLDPRVPDIITPTDYRSQLIKKIHIAFCLI